MSNISAISINTSETQRFLRTILPDHGVFALFTVPNDGRPPRHLYSENVEGLLEKKLSLKSNDVYFAVCALSGQSRKGVAFKSARALWIDIDIKPNGYESKEQVKEAIKEYVLASSMPAPSYFVQSGNGYHVYWAIEEELEGEVWQELANALKANALHHGLKFDTACTVDRVRVLRMPGSFNHKHGSPKPVALQKGSEKRYPAQQLRDLLLGGETITTPPTAGPMAKLANDDTDNSDLGGGVEKRVEPSYMHRIIERCGVMEHIAEIHGRDCEEPLWKDVLQLARFCQDGPEWVQPLSDGHPDYSQEETHNKFKERFKNSAGPTLCSTFEDYLPEKCRACVFRGQIKSPISLGTDNYRHPDEPPYGWRLSEDGNSMEQFTLVKDVDENGKRVIREEWRKAFEYAIARLSIFKNEAGEHEMYFEAKNHSYDINVAIPITALKNKMRFAEAVANKGVFLQDEEDASLRRLLMDWLKQLQQFKKVGDSIAHLGWTHSDEEGHSFITAARTFYKGRAQKNLPPLGMEAFAKHFTPKGHIESWREAANAILSTKQQELVAVVASAFAGPLMYFTDISGALLSVTSHRSGVGKTSAMKVAQAVWAAPDSAMSSLDDTEASVAKKMTFLHNLPAYWDELRGDNAMDDFAKMTFKLTQGKERTRLKADTSMREVSSWQTMMVAASNSSIMAYVGHTTGYSEAGILRVFEVNVPALQSTVSQSEARRVFAELKNNYGTAGEVYAKFLIKNVDSLQKIVNSFIERVHTKSNAVTNERFWVTTAGVILAGAFLAKKAGILDFNTSKLERFLLANIDACRQMAKTREYVSSAPALLMRYLDANLQNRLVTDRMPLGKGRIKAQLLADAPRYKVAYQIAVEDKILRVPFSGLSDWLVKSGHKDAQQIIDDLIMLYGAKRHAKATLGAGTHYATQRGVVLDLNLMRDDLRFLYEAFASTLVNDDIT